MQKFQIYFIKLKVINQFVCAVVLMMVCGGGWDIFCFGVNWWCNEKKWACGWVYINDKHHFMFDFLCDRW